MRVGSKSHERPLCYAASRSWKQSKPCDLILSSEGWLNVIGWTATAVFSSSYFFKEAAT